MPDATTRKKSNAVRSDLYLPRESFAAQTTYVGSKGDIRRLIGIGPEYAPHGATVDKTWVAYELLSPELPNQTGNRQRFSNQGLPVYHVSLTAFRFWAKHVAVLVDAPATIQQPTPVSMFKPSQVSRFILVLGFFVLSPRKFASCPQEGLVEEAFSVIFGFFEFRHALEITNFTEGIVVALGNRADKALSIFGVCGSR